MLEHKILKRMAVAVALALTSGWCHAGETRQFTYAWPYTDGDTMSPRGGSTKGPPVTLDTEPSEAWQGLQEPGLADFERDRRAILAMAGPYRASFDFLETVGFVPGYTPQRPYQSWGTEYVYVVEDRGDFISLQHIIVMFFTDEEGQVSGPAVMKHWRQDWQYEDQDLHVYVGLNTWEHQSLSRKAAKGAWSQAVFQVDDSPRYESIGRWEHHNGHSSWESADTWRPLPRREFSARDDYHVLSGINRHTITPTGWVHEQDNLKLVLDEKGRPAEKTPYLAREIGFNRYERITGHDFAAGDEYWHKTGPFWAEVRDAWRDYFKERERFTLKADYEGQRLFAAMFDYADNLSAEEDYDAHAARTFIQQTLDRYLQ